MSKDIKSKLTPLKNPYTSLFMTIIGISLLTVIFILILYFYYFNNGISNKSSEWANFGSYFSGSISPILNFLAIIFAILSLNITFFIYNEQRKESRIERLYILIEKIDKELEVKIKTIDTKNIPQYTGPIQPRPRNEFKCLQVANIFNLLYNWLNRITEIDSHDALAIHISQKHIGFIGKINKNKWFEAVGDKDGNIYKYYTKQAARLFRDD